MTKTTHWVAKTLVAFAGCCITLSAHAGPGGGPWGPWGTTSGGAYGGFGPYDPYIRRGIPIQQGLSTASQSVWVEPRGFSRVTTIESTPRNFPALEAVGEEIRMAPAPVRPNRRFSMERHSVSTTTSIGNRPVAQRDWVWERRGRNVRSVEVTTTTNRGSSYANAFAYQRPVSRTVIAGPAIVGERVAVLEPVGERVVRYRQVIRPMQPAVRIQRTIISQPIIEPVGERIVTYRRVYRTSQPAVRVQRIVTTRQIVEPVGERVVTYRRVYRTSRPAVRVQRTVITKRIVEPVGQRIPATHRKHRHHTKRSGRVVIERTTFISDRPSLVVIPGSRLEPVGEFYSTRVQRVGPAFSSWETDFNNPYR